ncbi:MAG: serine--tRNA ligase [Candidatus Eremiobacter antarcticus]|nr:serine--tRNA ligase [Candidatus Eremiobacteraeota bacterium]MBC5807388.1 serine--tRNA ligase [Candidatus Eremiobacteraeota bacterium]PZR63139.1 MAG: serine--tRNA ligase [Candidatus Eremiobacter sp. RRmetagenome_bin22]
MLDKALIRDHPDAVRRSLRRRGLDASPVDEIVALDEQWRRAATTVDALKAQRNQISAGFARAKEQGESALAQLRAESTALGVQIQGAERSASEADLRLHELLSMVPNIVSDDIPDGDASANVELRRWGEPTKFSFEPKPHWEIGERLGIIDFERGVRMARSRFAVLAGLGARLNRALIDLFLTTNVAAQFREIAPPILVNRDAVEATGHLSKFSDVMFSVEDGALFLSPTSEVQLVNLHRGEMLEAADLPKRYTAYTPCFREEAGAAGKDTRGLIRQHQFEKVELVSICTPEQAAAQHEQITGLAEALLQTLQLPYRVMMLSSQDTGFAARKTYDLEVWLPGQQAYREISSCSDCGDFQARRAAIRFRPAPKARPEFAHTLNGSALAVGRTLVAILENFQQEDGSVRVPDALVPYLGGVTVVR